MSTYFNDIVAALDTHLDTMDSTPIAWPNYKHLPDGTYLRPNYLPTSAAQVSLGSTGKDEHTGIYQIDVVVKQGSGRPALLDTVADHFKRGTVLTYNDVKLRVRTVELGTPINDGAWYFTPVSVYVYTYLEARQ